MDKDDKEWKMSAVLNLSICKDKNKQRHYFCVGIYFSFHVGLDVIFNYFIVSMMVVRVNVYDFCLTKPLQASFSFSVGE